MVRTKPPPADSAEVRRIAARRAAARRHTAVPELCTNRPESLVPCTARSVPQPPDWSAAGRCRTRWLRRIRVCRSLARGGSPCVGSRRSVETRAFRIGIAGHQHKVEHTAGNEGQHAEDQQDNAADADAVACLQRPERKTAADDEDQTDGEEDSGGRLYRVDDGQHGATHVDVMQTTYAKRDGRHKHDESPNGGERVSDGGDHAGIGEVPQRAEHESQHESDDGIGEEPPPELATRGAALEHRVLLEETDDRLAQVAAICGHVKRRGQCEEAIARLRLRCRLPVIRGWSLAVLRACPY